ncbi:MAG: glycosyltransferase [Syntrophaceae bacterium]|nr:glycosyltransferase [Syntrophaceae bacterium]
MEPYKNIYSKNDRILIVGNLPLPIGGVSIHCSRLYALLKKSHYDVDFFNLAKFIKCKKIKKIILLFTLLYNKYTVVHIQTTDIKVNKIIFIIKRIKKYKIYLSVHNPRLFSQPPKKVLFFKKYIPNLDLLILVSQDILDKYRNESVNLPQNIIVKSAYLPPTIEEEQAILSTYPESLKRFLSEKNPLLIANAWKIVFMDGIDLYGLDLCVDLVSRLKSDFPNIGLIFALANSKDEKKYLNIKRAQIKTLNIDKQIYFLSNQKILWPLFKKVHIFIRPSYSDGSAVSINEALDLGCKVIASNCCKRPSDVILFQNRDLDDLIKIVKKTLKGIMSGTK